MTKWVEKDGYDTCLQATPDMLQSTGTEIYLIRFHKGKNAHYHKRTTEFFHFTAGHGRVRLDGQELELRSGGSLIISPFVEHTFINDSTDNYLEAVLVKTNADSADTYTSP